MVAMQKLALVGNRDGKVVLHWGHLLARVVVMAIVLILLETAWRWILSQFSERGPETIQKKLVMGFSISAGCVAWMAWQAWASERKRLNSPPPAGPTHPAHQ